jgi:hypothetical protein
MKSDPFYSVAISLTLPKSLALPIDELMMNRFPICKHMENIVYGFALYLKWIVLLTFFIPMHFIQQIHFFYAYILNIEQNCRNQYTYHKKKLYFSHRTLHNRKPFCCCTDNSVNNDPAVASDGVTH